MKNVVRGAQALFPPGRETLEEYRDMGFRGHHEVPPTGRAVREGGGLPRMTLPSLEMNGSPNEMKISIY